jgi:hypothetical protein
MLAVNDGNEAIDFYKAAFDAAILWHLDGGAAVVARRFDEAIAVCKKVSDEDPAFALTHLYLYYAYWGKRMYPQAIEELGIYAKLADLRDTSEIASVMEQGSRSAGWKGALTRRIEIMLARQATRLRTG